MKTEADCGSDRSLNQSVARDHTMDVSSYEAAHLDVEIPGLGKVMIDL